MDLLSPEFWSTLLSIIVIDLVLAGDNAIVIGLAARNLPHEQRKKAIIWGAIGAIVVRSLLTFIVVWLLEIPALRLIGGILLIWIAYKLLVEEKDHEETKAGANLWAAIKTIIVADTVMGLDNVLAVAGAASGSFVLVLLGLLVSVPIVMWGSSIILRWIERFPVIIYIGSGVLAYTASKMIVEEPFLNDFFVEYPVLRWGLTIVLVAGVILLGRRKKSEKAAINPRSIAVSYSHYLTPYSHCMSVSFVRYSRHRTKLFVASSFYPCTIYQVHKESTQTNEKSIVHGCSSSSYAILHV